MDVDFDDFAASEPEAPTAQPLTDDDTVNYIHTENDAPQEESEDEIPYAKLIKSTTEFLAIINQQKAFLKRNNLPIDIIEQLETLAIGNKFVLCSKQKEVTDYFKLSSESPNPKAVYKTVADVLTDITIVESLSDSKLDVDTMELDSINSVNITITSGAMNALLTNEVTSSRTSIPKCNKLETSTPLTALKKKLKMNADAVRENERT